MSEERKESLVGRDAVIEGLSGHPALQALQAWKPEALLDANFDRGELTLTIAAAEIRAAAATVQAAPAAAGLNDTSPIFAYPVFMMLPNASSSVDTS